VRCLIGARRRYQDQRQPAAVRARRSHATCRPGIHGSSRTPPATNHRGSSSRRRAHDPRPGKTRSMRCPHLSVDREPRAVLARLRPAAEVRDRHGGDAWSPSRSARDAARMLRSSIARSRHSSPSTGEYCVNSHARQKCVRCDRPHRHAAVPTSIFLGPSATPHSEQWVGLGSTHPRAVRRRCTSGWFRLVPTRSILAGHRTPVR
jgi:hypothetical protein